MVKKKAFLLVELLFFISAISIFATIFLGFETYILKTNKKLQDKKIEIIKVKDFYYQAMTEDLVTLESSAYFTVSDIDENYKKIEVNSDTIFNNLFIVRKKL
jgi:hypothetical protein